MNIIFTDRIYQYVWNINFVLLHAKYISTLHPIQHHTEVWHIGQRERGVHTILKAHSVLSLIICNALIRYIMQNPQIQLIFLLHKQLIDQINK